MEYTSESLSELIFQVINNILTKLFASLDKTIYSLLDNITFIDERYSKYDTVNAQKAESGLYNIIFLSKKGNIDADMAEDEYRELQNQKKLIKTQNK